MKTTLLLIALVVSVTPPKSASQFTWTIEIIDLRSSDGNILLSLFDEEQNTIKGAVKKKCK